MPAPLPSPVALLSVSMVTEGGREAGVLCRGTARDGKALQGEGGLAVAEPEREGNCEKRV